MTRSRPPLFKAFQLLLLVLILPLILSSCQGPQGAFVKGSRSVFDVIAPAHRAYLAADGSLDAAQKARRIRTIDAWEIMIKKAEAK